MTHLTPFEDLRHLTKPKDIEKCKPKGERILTKYPGVFFRIVDRIGLVGEERVYYVRYVKDKQKIEAKIGRQYADDMTPARANQIRADLIEGRRLTQAEELKLSKVKQISVSDVWEDYHQNHTSNKSISRDANLFKLHLKPHFKKKQMKDINHQDIDRLKINLSALSPKSVKNALELLVRLSNYGIEKRLCEGITFRIKYPEINNETTEDLTDQEFDNLMAVLREETNLDVKHIMLLAIYTGMRRSEILKLKWNDVNFQRGIIQIRNPKSGKDKIIPMNDLAREVFNDCIHHDSEYLFPGRGSAHRVDVNHEANRIKKEAGLPKDFRPMHGLRHFFATTLINSGKVDLNTLQRLMTHSSPAMTLRYAKIRDQVMADASNVLTDIFKKKK